MPFVVAGSQPEVIARSFENHPGPTWFATTLIASALLLQASVVMGLLRKTESSVPWAIWVAKVHGVYALILGLMTTFVSSERTAPLFAAWGAAWLGPGFRDAGYLSVNLLPLFVLAQWACLTKAEGKRTSREIWRGICISSLMFNALLGLWVFSPSFIGGDRWTIFQDPASTFFNLGVVVHVIAVVSAVIRSRFDWIWAGVVGFGCLVSGFILALFYNGGFFGDDNPTPSRQIGGILHMGWFELAHYLPIVAYILIASSSVALHRVSKPVSLPSNIVAS